MVAQAARIAMATPDRIRHFKPMGYPEPAIEQADTIDLRIRGQGASHWEIVARKRISHD
jgi:hypothetical protein